MLRIIFEILKSKNSLDVIIVSVNVLTRKQAYCRYSTRRRPIKVSPYFLS